MQTTNAYIMFTDIKNFSELDEGQLRIFAEEIWPEAYKVFESWTNEIRILNTWGDAIFMVFESTAVVRAILQYRDFFRDTDFAGRGLPALAVRIGCHFGSFHIFDDPVIGRRNVIGGNINTAARIEPVTRPNNIYVSEDFKHNFAADRSPDKPQDVDFDLIGDIPLAKNFGNQNVYLMREAGEDKHIIDRLLQQDLILSLPTPRAMTVEEKRQLQNYTNVPSSLFARHGDDISFTGDNSELLMEFTKLCTSKGLYEKALEKTTELENYAIEVNGVEVRPYAHRVEFLKNKANTLTRLGYYQESADITYGLWISGEQNSDTLCMLAAQYKRRALYDASGLVAPEKIDRPLLERSRNLYLEAFRIDIDDYYPAINTAYLNVIMGGPDAGKGRLLARYIITVWKGAFDQNWWGSATIAEAHLINDDFELATERFNAALAEHAPNVFEVEATRQQIDLYRHYSRVENQNYVQAIIDLLDEYLV